MLLQEREHSLLNPDVLTDILIVGKPPLELGGVIGVVEDDADGHFRRPPVIRPVISDRAQRESAESAFA